MQVNVTVDTSRLQTFTGRQVKQLAYNVAEALTNTIKDVQTAERVNLDRKFTIRKAGFMYNLIKITTFASARQGIPYAELAVDPTKSRVLLGLLETGGIKKPEVGKEVAVPITGEAARPTFGSSVPTTLQIGNLKFRQHRTKSGKIQWEGSERTYLIPGVGIFQRGAGTPRVKGVKHHASTPSKLIYAFKRAPVIKPVLHFIDIAIETATKAWPGRFNDAYKRP